MKAILGVDARRAYRPALELLARLRFNKLSLTLLHAVNAECAFEWPDAHTEAEYMKVVQNLGLQALDGCVDEACGLDIQSRSKLVMGRAADSLSAEAKAQDADLIALCATHSGRWSTNFMGSATSALVQNARPSLLIAKGHLHRSKGLRVVLATDHTSYAEKWISKLLTMLPRGIDHMEIVTAYSVSDEVASVVGKNPAMMGGDVNRWLEEKLQSKNEAVAARFSALGISVQTKAVEADPRDAIREAMQDFKADLLIIGSVGADSAPGTPIGSVALHEIAAEAYPVLVMRP